jgi:hypothetical protein
MIRSYARDPETMMSIQGSLSNPVEPAKPACGAGCFKVGRIIDGAVNGPVETGEI